MALFLMTLIASIGIIAASPEKDVLVPDIIAEQ